MGGGAERSVRSIGTEPAAFTEFYRAHVDEVTRFVARRAADPQLAADLTADVFLAAIEASRGKYGTWWLGDWQGIASGADAFHLVWDDTRNGKLDLFAATVRQ